MNAGGYGVGFAAGENAGALEQGGNAFTACKQNTALISINSGYLTASAV